MGHPSTHLTNFVCVISSHSSLNVRCDKIWWILFTSLLAFCIFVSQALFSLSFFLSFSFSLSLSLAFSLCYNQFLSCILLKQGPEWSKEPLTLFYHLHRNILSPVSLIDASHSDRTDEWHHSSSAVGWFACRTGWAEQQADIQSLSISFSLSLSLSLSLCPKLWVKVIRSQVAPLHLPLDAFAFEF